MMDTGALRNRLTQLMSTKYWKIAVRPRKEGVPLLYEEGALSDYVSGFRIMPGNKFVTYADPFLFEHGGKTWLFYERQDLTDDKGVLWCRCLEPEGDGYTNGKPFKVLEEDYHLSYPQVFEYGGRIFMIPESKQNGQVRLYECKSFPVGWEYVRTILTGTYVDTTILMEEGGLYLYSYMDKKIHVYRLPLSEEGILYQEPQLLQISQPSDRLRPGGRVIKDGDSLIRPSQICEHRYGEALSFRQGKDCADISGELTGAVLRPEILDFQEDDVNPIGTHTYDHSSKYEAIDILHLRVDPDVILKKIFWKINSYLKKS